MSLFQRFLRHETGTGREDWVVISALAVTLTTFLSLWLGSGGADQVTARLYRVISDAVNEIGNDFTAPSATPP